MSKPITVVQSLASAERGGAESFYTRLVCELVNYPEIEQHAFTRPWPDRVAQLLEAGLPVQTFKFGGPLAWRDRQKYRQALKDLKPDIVLTYMSRATFSTPPGDYKLAARLGHYYNLKYYRHCDYWIGISKGICKHLIDGGMPADRVFHIPNFVNETVAEPLPRASYDTPAGVPLLFACGRLHTNKAFDILLEALVDVPDAVLWLAGEGPEQKALEAQCRKLKLQDRVRFLGWRNDINSLMRTADIFVCPSRHEGLGSIVGESWFNECPIVAADSQGPGELIDNEVTGLVTPIDEPKPMADAINRLLGDAALSKSLAERAKRHYHEFYSQDIIVKRYVDFFKQIA